MYDLIVYVSPLGHSITSDGSIAADGAKKNPRPWAVIVKRYLMVLAFADVLYLAIVGLWLWSKEPEPRVVCNVMLPYSELYLWSPFCLRCTHSFWSAAQIFAGRGLRGDCETIKHRQILK